MLWYKTWLETRWRFLIGLALLIVVACGTVFDFAAFAKLRPLARSLGSTMDTSTLVGRQLKDAFEVESTYRGFVWWQWFSQNLAQMGTLFAALLGSGGLLPAAGGAALFTLSLPVSRNHLLWARAGTGLAELLVLAVVPSLVIPLVSPAIGQSYSIIDALVHAGCMFVAAAAFFSLAIWLSTMFSDLWRPLLLTCAVAVVFAMGEYAARAVSGYSIFGVMSAEAYFRHGALPWTGLTVSVAASAVLLFAASKQFARQDF